MPNYSGLWTMRQQMQQLAAGDWAGYIPPGSQLYTTAGTYSWVAPSGVTSVSAVCIGATQPWASNAYYGRGGGGLGWKNNIPVTPGSSYTVVVANGATPTDSYFISLATVKGGTASGTITGGTYVGDGGGNGGDGGQATGSVSGAGGGGAGGYAGNGGNGGNQGANSGTSADSNSGGGGGGAGGTSSSFGGGGGGVSTYGIGTTGAGGTYGASSSYEPGGGRGGSYGSNGAASNNGGAYGAAAYGGGLAGTSAGVSGGSQYGAVRIIWGSGRSFPSNAA